MSLNNYSLPQNFISPHSLSGLKSDTPLLVAFSGGSDSGALLHMTVKYAQSCGAKVFAAHVNHGIRGEEADRDELFCREAAKKYGIEIFVLKADVPAIAKKTQKSIETAARDVRYGYFSKIMKEHNIPILCVAHNAKDNFETVLFNISRGSGLSGVSGIPKTRSIDGGVLVRPILSMSKDSIYKYCTDNKIEYVTDSTNKDTEYTRNRIRSLVIPELKALCPGAEEAVARLTESLREDGLCLDNMCKDFLNSNRNRFFVNADKLNSCQKAVSSRVIMALYSEISKGEYLEYTHVNAVLELAKKKIPHSSLNLPCGVRAVVENNELGFTFEKNTQKNETEEYFYTLQNGINSISQINCEIIIGKTQFPKNIYKKSMKFFINSAKIIGVVNLRNRKPRDRIKMGGMNKSVKKLLCDKKIPLDIRYRIPMICDSSENIIAVPFLGIKDGYSAKEGDRNALPIEFGMI